MGQTPSGMGSAWVQQNPLSLWAIIAGGAGLVFIWIIWILGLLFALAGLVLGFLALQKANTMGGMGKTQAIIGMALGGAALLISLIVIVAYRPF